MIPPFTLCAHTALLLTPTVPSIPTALADGERCDGEIAGEDDSEDDSEDSSEASTGRKRGKQRARGRITGANDRRIFGQLKEATPPCGEGLVCSRVALGRRECRPENSAGEFSNQFILTQFFLSSSLTLICGTISLQVCVWWPVNKAQCLTVPLTAVLKPSSAERKGRDLCVTVFVQTRVWPSRVQKKQCWTLWTLLTVKAEVSESHFSYCSL